MTTSMKMPGSSFAFAAPAPERPLEGEFGWTSILRLLRRRWWQLAAVILGACLLALPGILSMPRLYNAQARVMISPTPVQGLVTEDTTRMEMVSTETEVERIVSRDIAQTIIDRFDLAARPEFNPALQDAAPIGGLVSGIAALLPANPSTDAPLDPQSEDRVMRSFLEKLEVNRIGLGDVVYIGFTSEDPALAAAVPGAVIETYRDRTDARWRAEVGAAGAWLESQIDTARDNVQDSREAIIAYQERTGLQAGDTAEEAADRLALLQGRTVELSKERVDLDAARRSVEASREDLDLSALSEPDRLAELRRERDVEQRELARTASVYGEKYAGIAVHQNRIAAIEEEMRTELDAYGRSLALRASSLDAEDDRISAEMSETRGAVAAIRNGAPELARLTATLEAREEALADLQNRQQRLASETPISPVSLEVLSPATPPLEPTGPGRKLYLLATALGGLLLGMLVVALLELRDGSVRSHEQLVHLPGLTPLGLLPALNGRQGRQVARAISERTATPFAESLRDALFMLECANGGRLPRSMVVTAAREADEGPPVAEWLALELAAAGHQVRLVNARDPRPKGARRTLSRGPSDFAHRPVEHLSLAVEVQKAGSLAAAVEGLVMQAEHSGTLTLFDAPPLHRSSSLQLSRKVGTTLLVMRWGRTPRRLADLLAGLLAKLGDVRAYSLIVEVDPARHRHYGFSDRISLTDPVPA